MLIECPSCGKPISTDALACPHCGYAHARNQNENVIIVLFLIFAGILALWGSSMEDGIFNAVYRFFCFAGAVGCAIIAFAVIIAKSIRR